MEVNTKNDDTSLASIKSKPYRNETIVTDLGEFQDASLDVERQVSEIPIENTLALPVIDQQPGGEKLHIVPERLPSRRAVSARARGLSLDAPQKGARALGDANGREVRVLNNATSTGIILYSTAICIDFLAIVFMHLCLFGSCWLNADTGQDSEFWGAPCTGDFWTLSQAGLSQGYWYIIGATVLIALVMLFLYAGLALHLTRLIIFFVNDQTDCSAKFNDYYLSIMAFNWLLLWLCGTLAFSFVTHNCITDGYDFYCQETYCYETNHICTYSILLKNSDYFSSSGLKIEHTWTGWSLAFGWVAIFLLLVSAVIYILLKVNYRKTQQGSPLWVESNKVMTREAEKKISQLYLSKNNITVNRPITVVKIDKEKAEAKKAEKERLKEEEKERKREIKKQKELAKQEQIEKELLAKKEKIEAKKRQARLENLKELKENFDNLQKILVEYEVVVVEKSSGHLEYSKKLEKSIKSCQNSYEKISQEDKDHANIIPSPEKFSSLLHNASILMRTAEIRKALTKKIDDIEGKQESKVFDESIDSKLKNYQDEIRGYVVHGMEVTVEIDAKSTSLLSDQVSIQSKNMELDIAAYKFIHFGQTLGIVNSEKSNLITFIENLLKNRENLKNSIQKQKKIDENLKFINSVLEKDLAKVLSSSSSSSSSSSEYQNDLEKAKQIIIDELDSEDVPEKDELLEKIGTKFQNLKEITAYSNVIKELAVLGRSRKESEAAAVASANVALSSTKANKNKIAPAISHVSASMSHIKDLDPLMLSSTSVTKSIDRDGLLLINHPEKLKFLAENLEKVEKILQKQENRNLPQYNHQATELLKMHTMQKELTKNWPLSQENWDEEAYIADYAEEYAGADGEMFTTAERAKSRASRASTLDPERVSLGASSLALQDQNGGLTENTLKQMLCYLKTYKQPSSHNSKSCTSTNIEQKLAKINHFKEAVDRQDLAEIANTDLAYMEHLLGKEDKYNALARELKRRYTENVNFQDRLKDKITMLESFLIANQIDFERDCDQNQVQKTPILPLNLIDRDAQMSNEQILEELASYGTFLKESEATTTNNLEKYPEAKKWLDITNKVGSKINFYKNIDDLVCDENIEKETTNLPLDREYREKLNDFIALEELDSHNQRPKILVIMKLDDVAKKCIPSESGTFETEEALSATIQELKTLENNEIIQNDQKLRSTVANLLLDLKHKESTIKKLKKKLEQRAQNGPTAKNSTAIKKYYKELLDHKVLNENNDLMLAAKKAIAVDLMHDKIRNATTKEELFHYKTELIKLRAESGVKGWGFFGGKNFFI